MRTLAFDGRMGASGDIILGALLDAGADPAVLHPIERAIDVTFDIDERVTQGIEATDVQVHHDDHEHRHDAEGGGPHRSYHEVLDVLDELDLVEQAAETAAGIFELLAEAEAAVHGTDIDDIHFHEVGADDAIADVTGSVALLHSLDVDHVVTGPLATGDGTVETSHGVYPIPPPAVVEIAARADLTIQGGPVTGELLTPTGAAVLGGLASTVDALPPIDLASVGYGTGTRTYESRPNVLRVFLGNTTGELRREEIRVLETNVDDVTPEVLGGLQDSLLEAGARDISITPLTMKKSRPGHLVRVVVDPADETRLARRLARETGTLGVRSAPTSHRWVANRDIVEVTLTLDGATYDCRVKVATDDAGDILDRSAEYDDAAAIARATDRPVKAVMQLAERASSE